MTDIERRNSASATPLFDVASGADESLALSKNQVLAWDLPTRLFKWSLVVCVVLAWATNKFADSMPYLHKWNGYAILVLIVFRLLWGLVGGSTARFVSFMTSPWAAARFFAAQIRGKETPYLGHSPVAGWVIAALIALIGTQAVLGLFSSDQDRLIVEGPLAIAVSDEAVHRASSLHRLGFNMILALVSLHIVANIIYDLVAGKGYIRAMWTGRKPERHYQDMPESRAGSWWAALACLAGAVAIVFGGIAAMGGHPFE